MCLAIPGKVLQIELDAQGVRMGKTNFGGIVKQVCLEYTPEVQCGDYVLVHVGFALGKVDNEEAERTYKLLAEMNQLTELEVESELKEDSESGISPAAPLLTQPAEEPTPRASAGQRLELQHAPTPDVPGHVENAS